MHAIFRPLSLCLLSLSLLAAPVLAGTERLLRTVEASGLPPESFSLLAVELGDSDAGTLLSLNPHLAKSPASVTKLITAAVVLREIPVGTRFETRVYRDGPLENGILRGNLILKGGGDPSFVSETLWLLVNRLHQEGLRAVEGDIIVDDTLFDAIGIDPGRDTKRSEQAYDAPIGAMSFNWNSAHIRIRPGERVSAPARVHVDPPSDYLELSNRAATVAGNAISNLAASRREDPESGRDIITVSGNLGIHSNGFDTHRNISHPARWSGANLKLYLRYLDIDVAGDVQVGPLPAGAQPLAAVEGRPVEQLVVDMNKVSSNFIAEMLTKNVAARRLQPGTMSGGLEVMNHYMAGLGLDPTEYLLVNPAGLTYTNRLSAYALIAVLRDVMGDFRIAPEFIASLPVAGLDGTLRRRMQDSPARGWVRAKTGYVDGAVSLAGFARRPNGNPVIYAFLYNGPAPAWQVRGLYDELSALLVTLE